MAAALSPTLAYLTVLDDERTGWTGGLLVLNKGGRPMEFHCTLPIRPSRAHEILFGVTLRQHLIGEVIAPLLLEKCRSPVSILCCNQLESMRLTMKPDYPSALVREAWERAAPELRDIANDANEDSSHDKSMISELKTVLLAGSRLLVHESQCERVREIVRQLSDLPDAVEPFERIREAINEAQSQGARTAATAARPAA